MTKKQALDATKKLIDMAFERGEESFTHSISDLFSFAGYLNENFHYFDNTDLGDVYKDNDGDVLYTEEDIYDEWLNNR
jgi:hypothetical protein